MDGGSKFGCEIRKLTLMKFVMSHRTAAFATHNATIRAALVTHEPVKLPHGFTPELTTQQASSIAERLVIDELICGIVLERNKRKSRESYFTRQALISSDESAYITLGNGLFLPCPEHIFLQMSAELDLIELIRFGYDLCGSYIPGHSGLPTIYGVTPLTSAERLSAFCRAHLGVRHADKAMRAARHIIDKSASPLESNLAMMLSLPFRLGGFNTGKPVMNSLYERHGINRYPDLFWPELGIDVEYDSDEFHNDATRDAERRNELASSLSVLIVTAAMMANPEKMYRFARDFYRIAGKQFRPQTADYELHRKSLFNTLRKPEWYLREPYGPYRRA